MNTTWRRIACAAALACALPVSAANPTSSARIGPMQITVVDTDLTDGIEAGYTLLGDRGRHFDTSFVVTDTQTGAGSWVIDNQEFDPEEGATALFSESDGASIRAFAEATPAMTYADGVIVDIWSIALTANTLLTVEMDAEVDPSGGYGWASANFGIGGQTFSEVIQAGAGLFRFEYTSGPESLVGTINRRVSATALIPMEVPPAPIPEPSTALLVLLGLGGLALRRMVKASRPGSVPALGPRCALALHLPLPADA